MIRVALKMLFRDRLKYLGLVLGVAFASLLIAQQLSILVGLAEQTGGFIRDTAQADLWIMDPQVRFSQDSLPLRDTILQLTRGTEGVAWAVPLFQQFVKGRMSDGTRFTMILVGLDDATLTGGPPLMVQGTMADLRRDKAVIINQGDTESLEMRQGGGRSMQVGDRFAINDTEAIIVGEYQARPSFFWEPVIYTTYSRALTYALPDRNLMTFVMAKVRPGYDIAEVARRIAQRTGQAARTNQEFLTITMDYILNSTGILINFGIAVALGFVIGLLVAGQTLYNFTIENLRHYGALKAMGVGDWDLAKMVLTQALVVAALGYGIGVGVASLFGAAIRNSDLAFSMPWQIPAFTFVSIVSICAVASVVSLHRVFKLEPAVVFNSA
jgi:putative ABC transport system permease protein